jgi:hypothetical protein
VSILENFDLSKFQFVNIPQETSVKSAAPGSAIRISCFSHTLQLAIREGLQKVPQITKILEKAKILARCSQKSTKIADLLDQLHKHIERTTITRWNSEFMLIKSIWSINREDLESIASLMDNPIRFSTNDLAIMEEMIDILDPFYQISLKCQAEKIATVSMVVPSIVHLISHLRTFKESVIIGDTLAQQLQSAIERRFAGIINRLKLLEVKDEDPFSDPLYFMAAVLDPTFKCYWIYDLKLPASTETRLKQHIVQVIIDEISKDWKPSSTALVASVDATNSSLSSSPASVSTKSKIERRKLFVYDDYRCKNNHPIGSRVSEPAEELESYLNVPTQSSFSEYWQHSQLTALKNLVYRLFSVQASSAPVERVFSHAGLIFSSRRTRMTAQLFQDLVFLKVNHSLL